jgi:integrase
MPRNRRGMGGVRRIERLNGWQATFTLNGKTWAGPVRAKMDDADKDRINFVYENGDPTGLPPETVEEYFTRWLRKKQATVTHNTYHNYEIEVRLRIIPTLGATKLPALRVRQINDLLLAERERRAAGSVHLLRVTLSAGLKDAMREGIVTKNVASLAVSIPQTPKQYVVFTQPQARAFLAACGGTRYEALFTAIFSCGLRLGEACGLRWEDINLTTGATYIEGQFQRSGGRWLRAPIKNNRTRWIVLPLPALQAVQIHRNHSRVHAEHITYDNHLNLVFPSIHGHPLDDRTVNDALRRILADAGLPHMTAHGLRHSCASILAAQGVPDVKIAALLGHASPDITRKIYLHADIQARQDVADVMGGVLRG